MAMNKLRVLLMEDDADYATVVQRWLSEPVEGVEFILSWTDSLASGKARLLRGGIDVVLADLGLPDSSGMDTFRGIKETAIGLPILVLSGRGDESTALEAILNGAQDYLVKTTCSGLALRRSLCHANARHKFLVAQTGQETEGKGKLIGVLGVKGGTGATTLACILSAELSVMTRQRILLIDSDLSSGMAAFHMGLQGKYSVVDAAERVEELDEELWNLLICRRSSVDVLPAPASPCNPEIDMQRWRQILEFARERYDWIVIDAGKFAPQSLVFLEGSTETLLVTNPSIPSLHAAKRVLDYISGTSQAPQRIRVVVNQGECGSELSSRDLDQLFGEAVQANLPNCSEEIRIGLLKNSLPAVNSPLRLEIVKLARKLTGIEEPKAKVGLASLFSFLGKPDKVEKSTAELASQQR